MKKYIFYISILSVLFFSSCYKEEIILSKPGEPIDPVENLEYAIADTNVNLTWDLPASFSADIIQPVSVQIRISINGQNAGTQVLENAPESYTHTPYDPANEYRFTVKVVGNVDTSDPHRSDLRYSPGKTVAF